MRLGVTEREIQEARLEMEGDGDGEGDEGDLWYLRRLDGGLFTLQSVDYILGWLCMEDDGVSFRFLSISFKFDLCLLRVDV